MPDSNKLLYGINTCQDLYEKLKYEAERLEKTWNIYDCFNFILTAWHLHHDWLERDSENRPRLSTKKKEYSKTTKEMMRVIHAFRDVANSSKHLRLKKGTKKVVDEIHPREIRGWDAYFLHGPLIGISIGKSYFNMWDLRFLIMSYFEWIFDDSIPANQFPEEIKKHLERCVISE
jgi:hypothetical protein